MKDLAVALEEELETTGVPRNEVVELILDGKCKATDLSCLTGMESLEKLSLCNVGLSSLAGFPSLPKLTSLVLADNRIADGLQNLMEAELPGLSVLSLAHNRIGDVRELEPLREMRLAQLDLCECPLVQNTPEYRKTVLEMFPALQVLDNLDREGIELTDDEDDDEELDESSEEDDTDEEDSEVDNEGADGGEVLNLITDSDDDDVSVEQDSEPEEIHVSVLAGPPIVDEKSDEDQDYVMSDNDADSEEGSFESDEDVSVSQHFAAGSSSAGPAAAGSSAPSSGAKRKRTTHGTEDLSRDVPQDEDYADI